MSRRSISDGADGSDGDARRKRIRQACLNCRRKKIRCGGEKPVCTFCSRLSQPCVYTEDGRTLRHSSTVLNESGCNASDVAMEEMSTKLSAFGDRLSRIENTLQRLEPLLTSLSTLPAMLVNQGISHPSTKPQTPSLPCPTPTPAPQAKQNEMFPPSHTLLFAADIFFRFCHNQPYSLFHETTFRRQLLSGELPEHLVWAFLGSARQYSPLPDFQLQDVDDAMHYAAKSWDCIRLPWDGVATDAEVVAIVQSINLIVGIEHPSGACGAAYMKFGFAVRIALHSKLHMEPAANLSSTTREERRRTFWSLYLQDKLICLSRERFPAVRDDECRLQLPCSERAFREGLDETAPTLDQFTIDCLDQEAAERCCPLALIIVMASTLSRVSNYALQADRYMQLGLPWSSSSPYAAISSTLLQLEHCFGMNQNPQQTLKQRCLYDGAVDQHIAGPFIYSKALFHLSHCLLNHPFLIQQRLQKLKQKAPPSFMKTAWNSCRTHAKGLTVLRSIKNHNVLTLTSIYGYCTMVAGTIHVLSMNDQDESVREEGREHYKAAMEFLKELSLYWKHAALMANRLERFKHQCSSRGSDMDPCTEKPHHSPGDVESLWQSVDYALLSAPTRPGSPVCGDDVADLEFWTSPSQLFDFANFGMLGEGVDVAGTLPLLGDKYMFAEFGVDEGSEGSKA